MDGGDDDDVRVNAECNFYYLGGRVRARLLGASKAIYEYLRRTFYRIF